MRKLLFATNEVLIPMDVQDLEDCPGLDASSLYAALTSGVSDTSMGSSPMVCVLSGLRVSSSVDVNTVTFTVAPGTLVYRLVSDTSPIAYKLATIREPLTITCQTAPANNHKSVWVELTVSEVTTQAERTFREDVNGRITYEERLTNKYVNSVLSVRVREGVVTSTGSTPYLPVWDSQVLPIAVSTVTDSTANVRDTRKVYRSACDGRMALQNPIQANVNTFQSLLVSNQNHYHTIARNYVGFGDLTPSDYCELATSVQVITNVEGGTAGNMRKYVYALRPFPNVGCLDLIISTQAPDAFRRLNGGTFNTEGGWPLGTTVTGNETCYLYSIWYASSGKPAGSITNGNTTALNNTVYSSTVDTTNSQNINAYSMAISLLNVGVIAWTSIISYVFDSGSAAPTVVQIRVGNSGQVLVETNLNDLYKGPAHDVNSQYLSRPMQFCLSMDTPTGNQPFIRTTFEGSDITDYSITQILTAITEVFNP